MVEQNKIRFFIMKKMFFNVYTYIIRATVFPDIQIKKYLCVFKSL